MAAMESGAPPTELELPLYRTLFSAYPDALLLVDAAGIIALANPMAAQLFGYDVAELVGLKVDALVPDAFRPRHAAYREAYARQPRARPMGTQIDLVARRRDGSEVVVEIALSPLRDHGLPYVVAAIRGIGAYPRVQQALRRARYAESLARFGRLAVDTRDPQQLLRHAPGLAAEALQAEAAAVYLLESNGQELRVASRHGQVPDGDAPLRPTAATVPGRVIARGDPVIVGDLVEAGGDAASHASAIGVALQDRGRSIGALVVYAHRPNRFGDDELHFVESCTSLLGTSLQRARSEEALNHAQRLESVGQLTGGIAHDFNNLLTVIQGNLQVLEELPALQSDEFAQQLVGAAARASRRGAELTGKLLAFSRRQVLSPRRVEVPALLQSLADLLRRTLDQRIRIAVEVEPECPACHADPGQLEAALLNIAINARDAMPEGGRLTFRASALERPPARARGEPDATTAGYVAIAIADSGTGMTEAVMERAFEPFFTTKEAGRGTGLGLSTVYGFVAQSHGAVALDSRPGAGTTVTLYVPCHAQAVPAAPEGAAALALAHRGLRVLLVEDDREVAAVALQFLNSFGCEVTACGGAEAALALLQGAGFDLLFSDIALGAGMRGTELAQRAHALEPRLAVLLTSGYSAELVDARDAAVARWEVLRKPYTRDDLAQAIARARSADTGLNPPPAPRNPG